MATLWPARASASPLTALLPRQDMNSWQQDFWELVMALLLCFVALWTPYEVSFLDPKMGSGIFWLNRVVDLSFLVDMVRQFFIPYPDSKCAARRAPMEGVSRRRIGISGPVLCLACQPPFPPPPSLPPFLHVSLSLMHRLHAHHAPTHPPTTVDRMTCLMTRPSACAPHGLPW